jgi:hypothetical protein
MRKERTLEHRHQVCGTGELDLVLVPGFKSHLDYMWQEPGLARFLTNLSGFSRLILYDKRGTELCQSVAK